MPADSSQSFGPLVQAPTGPLTYRFANVEFDVARSELRVAGKPTALERRPWCLLEVLLQHVNEVVTKEELFETLWSGRATVDHVLANAVSKLRAAIGPEAAQRVLHKDLKPGNVLIEEIAGAGDRSTPRWQIRLTDFGSGRLLDSSRLDALRVTAFGLTQTQHAGTDSRSGTSRPSSSPITRRPCRAMSTRSA